MSKIVKVILLLFVVLFVFGCDSSIKMVETGTFNGREQTTIGNAFKAFFAKPKWKLHETENKTKFVLFEGAAKRNSIWNMDIYNPDIPQYVIPKGAKFQVQFLIKNDKTFEIDFMKIEVRINPVYLTKYNITNEFAYIKSYNQLDENNLLIINDLDVASYLLDIIYTNNQDKVDMSFADFNPQSTKSISLMQKIKNIFGKRQTIEDPKSNVSSSSQNHTNQITEKKETETVLTYNDIASISSSTSLKNYEPKNIYDGDNTTAWAEGAKGSGIGEWIKCEFNSEKTISKIEIVPGFDKMHEKLNDLWELNNQLKEIQVTFSDGSSQLFSLEKGNRLQSLQLKPVNTSSVTLTIKSVYNGTKWDDTVISGVKFYSKN